MTASTKSDTAVLCAKKIQAQHKSASTRRSSNAGFNIEPILSQHCLNFRCLVGRLLYTALGILCLRHIIRNAVYTIYTLTHQH